MALKLCLFATSAVCGLFCLTASRVAPTASSISQSLPSRSALLRFPSIDRGRIVFTYAGDLWIATPGKGDARRLTRMAGRESFPRFSPDGRTIAFTGEVAGGESLLTVPTDGGEPTRLTFFPGLIRLCQWTKNNRLLFETNAFRSQLAWRVRTLYSVAPTGGLPIRLPVVYGADGALSPNGHWLAYTPYQSEFESAKRYIGGYAQDIWLLGLQTRRSKCITDWTGTDAKPMWHGSVLYYVSDAGPERRLNLWRYDPVSGHHAQVTHLADFDVKWPSLGTGADGSAQIVFQYGARISLLDIRTGKVKPVTLTLPQDANPIASRSVEARNAVVLARPLPASAASAEQGGVVLEARGDIWTVAGDGMKARNLTATSGAAERDPAVSPDGKNVAYFSDASGEYQLTVNAINGGDPRQLTHLGHGFRYRPAWSPNGAYLAFGDNTGRLYLTSADGRKTQEVDRDPLVQESHISFSPDSAWLAYTRGGQNGLAAVWLYHIPTGRRLQITSGRYMDSWPAFDPQGDYLYFISRRAFSSTVMDRVDYPNFIYDAPDTLLAVPLRRGLVMPWGRRPTAEAGGTQSVRIDTDGFEERAGLIPLEKGAYSHLVVAADGSLVFSFVSPIGAASVRRMNLAEVRTRQRFDPVTVAEGDQEFEISSDGRMVCVRKGSRLTLYPITEAQGKPVSFLLPALTVSNDPRTEWRQIFTEAWRIYRDFFYDARMNGTDWDAMYRKYLPLLDACSTRDDVNYVITELIGELSNSHAYISMPGDTERTFGLQAGMLGVDFTLDQGAYRIQRIYEGAVWDTDLRNPLHRPGITAQEGDYLLAVNGTAPDTHRDPWAALLGRSDTPVTLTLGNAPVKDASARDVVVVPRSYEDTLRYRAWVESNRAYVERKTAGRVGYLCLPDTYTYGMSELGRQLYGQRDKLALIIDARWNEGGHRAGRLIEMLNRTIYDQGRTQHGGAFPIPVYSKGSPRCLLTNGLCQSGGDGLAYHFKKSHIGPIIGSRTAGNFCGAGGPTPSFLDGGRVEVPHIGDDARIGNSRVEGYGIPPDIFVPDDPATLMDGDPCLDTAIRWALTQIRPQKRHKLP